MNRLNKGIFCAAAAAAILGGSLIAAEQHRVPVAEACVVRAQESGFCVIAGRPARETSSVGGEAAATFPRGEGKAEEIRTKDIHIEVVPIEGVLPEPVESVRADVYTGEPAETTARASFPEGKARYLGSYKITGYDICVHCCGKTDGITSSGTQATVGRTCAAPPDIPFGTRIWIAGIGERVVEDRGGLGSSKIDVLCADHAACYAITSEGKVDVWILEG